MNDVNVLTQACCAFRKFFLNVVEMDRFRQATTISIRTMFLKVDTVSIIPSAGYRRGDRQSLQALQWLAYIGRSRNNITHAGNGRDVHLFGVPNVKIDRYCAEKNEIFEYLGCF